MLEPDGRRVRPLNPARDTGTDEAGERRRPDGVFVLGDLRHDREGSRAAERDRCPACDMDEGTRFLGAGLASLASVAITELFTGGQLPDPKKTLLFNDSVQDAAHRAGFVASRSYSFSLRTLLAAVLDNYPGRQASLNDLIADVIAHASNPQWLPAVVPPDLQGRADVDALLAGESHGRRGHLAADQPAARVPGGPGVRAPLPAGPHAGAHPHRRRRGGPRRPGADRRARQGPHDRRARTPG